MQDLPLCTMDMGTVIATVKATDMVFREPELREAAPVLALA